MSCQYCPNTPLHFCCDLQYTDRANPAEKHVMVMANKFGIASAPITPQMFASAGIEHMEKYGRNNIIIMSFN